ncbi:hypothetical protein KIN20_022369 [Parelaphostrongylus tenuis]|uniref:Uncharacterized protein n=1 Tax=Parelaphostrongylus tenuis TaxID=148309 RepID=A0AAD5QS76_PARTN|nr:hypothetical protein KIN20_022369 [Parelaphostrongylus tenuis]
MESPSTSNSLRRFYKSSKDFDSITSTICYDRSFSAGDADNKFCVPCSHLSYARDMFQTAAIVHTERAVSRHLQQRYLAELAGCQLSELLRVVHTTGKKCLSGALLRMKSFINIWDFNEDNGQQVTIAFYEVTMKSQRKTRQEGMLHNLVFD